MTSRSRCVYLGVVLIDGLPTDGPIVNSTDLKMSLAIGKQLIVYNSGALILT